MDLADIQAPIRAQLTSIHRIIENKFIDPVPTVQRILKEFPVYQGKLIRPTLMFLLAGVRGCTDPQLPRIAAEMEMLHLSSLIHDDVMDHSTMRRGRRSLNMDEGNQMSILWGDYLFVNAFRGLNATGRIVAVGVAMDVAARMIEGQMLELDHQHDLDTSLDAYTEIISMKTGSLFAGIARIAASLEAPLPADAEAYADFGNSLGMLFQIRDDLIDIISPESGKDRYRDLQEGKITLPVILLLRKQGRQVRKLLRERNYAAIGDLMRRSGVHREVENRIEFLSTSCRNFISQFPASPFRESLLGMVAFMGVRNY
ncbi:MAG TPA: polyprenyl synthetase family protein [Candidatus Aminicenantes bacterium]|nr:polyprenyl synthetase family protein [Candidatus Aminicenantes bacterium]